ncbi:MAG TPA: hypothetical protein VEG68_05870 [Terriglobales bacterium]|nr:hypothetical protein [Terriglobales bacterium]
MGNMILRRRNPILCSLIAAGALFAGGAQAKANGPNPGDTVPALKTVSLKPAKVGGKWRIAWDVRLGTVRGILILKQRASQVSGTFEENGKTHSLAGSIQGHSITFQVPFTGTYPFTIEFNGTIDRGKMSGTSASVGGGPVYLGHGGEVDEPQRPWLAIKGLKHQLVSPNKPPKEDDDD